MMTAIWMIFDETFCFLLDESWKLLFWVDLMVTREAM